MCYLQASDNMQRQTIFSRHYLSSCRECGNHMCVRLALLKLKYDIFLKIKQIERGDRETSGEISSENLIIFHLFMFNGEKNLFPICSALLKTCLLFQRENKKWNIAEGEIKYNIPHENYFGMNTCRHVVSYFFSHNFLKHFFLLVSRWKKSMSVVNN